MRRVRLIVNFDSRRVRWNCDVWIEGIGTVYSTSREEYWIAVRDSTQWLSESEYSDIARLRD